MPYIADDNDIDIDIVYIFSFFISYVYGKVCLANLANARSSFWNPQTSLHAKAPHRKTGTGLSWKYWLTFLYFML